MVQLYMVQMCSLFTLVEVKPTDNPPLEGYDITDSIVDDAKPHWSLLR
jgi:hypothetical protein